jgi:aspartate racemase
MGPLASAEFVKTIYQLSRCENEQALPPLALWSDPCIPDRTESILNNNREALLEGLIRGLTRLTACDVTDIVICCVTIHHVLDQLPAELRRKVISLIDVIHEHVLSSDKQYLLLCTNGTRQIRLFENHYLWNRVQGRIVLPSAKDQERIHQLIYRIKQYRYRPADVDFLNELTKTYAVDSFIAGCTEIHVLVREYGLSLELTQKCPCLDPLMILAEIISDSRVSSRPGSGQYLDCASERGQATLPDLFYFQEPNSMN